MPRRNRRLDQEPPTQVKGYSALPPGTEAAGFDVRRVTGTKQYICPGCDHPVSPGMAHLVVVPDDDVEARRHWHTACWRSELRRNGPGSSKG